MKFTRIHALIALLALVGGALVGVPLARASSAPAFEAPFACGYRQTVTPGSRAHATPWELDWRTPTGTPVHAAAAGTVRTASFQQSNGYGKLVVIDHGNGWATYYAHLDKIRVTVGQKVSRGQYLGNSGNTSAKYAIGAHLHFEVRHGSSYPANVEPAVFHGKRFPYPAGTVTSQNCPAKPTPTKSATRAPSRRATAKSTPAVTAKASASHSTTPKATATTPTRGATPRVTATTRPSKTAQPSTTSKPASATPGTPKAATTAPTTAPATRPASTTAPSAKAPADPTTTPAAPTEPPAPETDGPDLSDTNPQNEEPGPSADADPGPAVAATPKPAAQQTRPAAPKVTAPADAPRDAKNAPGAVPAGATQAPAPGGADQATADEKGTAPVDPNAEVGPAAEKDATGGLARTGR